MDDADNNVHHPWITGISETNTSISRHWNAYFTAVDLRRQTGKRIHFTVIFQAGLQEKIVCLMGWLKRRCTLGLPNSIIIALVERNNKYFISEGSTRILSGDRLYVMADDSKSMEKLYICLGQQPLAKINK